ncbi:hypothetical protein Ac2012v2_002877 [Leucoagaricus gongylophorus]
MMLSTLPHTLIGMRAMRWMLDAGCLGTSPTSSSMRFLHLEGLMSTSVWDGSTDTGTRGREYDASGYIVAMWANAQLPNPIWGINVSVVYWTGAHELSGHIVSSYQGAEKGSAPSDSDGAMRTEGSPMIPDDAMVGKDSLKDWRVIRDCFDIPYQPQVSWNNNASDKILEGPMPIMKGWPELRKAECCMA